MTESMITYMLLYLCIAILLIAEALATSRKSRSLPDIITGKGQMAALNSKHFSGIIVFSTGCWYYSSLPASDTAIFEAVWSDQWSFICLAITVIAMITGYRTAGVVSQKYITTPLATFSLTICLLHRVVFLFLYECFFRGVLLFTFIDETGPVFAIVINIFLYTLAHCYSSRKEIIGTIPFGLLLCMVTLLHHSVWPAIIIHLALALSHEIRLVINKHSSIKSTQL